MVAVNGAESVAAVVELINVFEWRVVPVVDVDVDVDAVAVAVGGSKLVFLAAAVDGEVAVVVVDSVYLSNMGYCMVAP